MTTTKQEKKRGAFDFNYYYDSMCVLKDLSPVSAIKANIGKGIIDICVDSLKYPDWAPMLESIKINRNLRFYSFKSKLGSKEQKSVSKASFLNYPSIVTALCSSLKDTLSISSELRFLEFQNIPLSSEDIDLLKYGISRNCSLNHLSLDGCLIGDKLCKS
ncbi:Centrosomal protein of 78 kDa [Cichlidogyrus casuarinus]|uniref:Centrosomal protein of 78 kDa n=1 Tax=Cichlidogyrus casuarinus TaxID=1844966 RepID=A0ABD2QFJ5_9PLAT